MAKADADHWHALGIGPPDEILQWRDKGMVLISAVARPGQQPAIGVVDIIGKLHPLDMPCLEAEAAPRQQAGEHVRVVAQLVLQLGGRLAALKYADTHENPAKLPLTEA